MNKILIVKLDHIGDLILATPVFRAVKERYPKVQLDLVAAAKSAQVVQNSPFIDNVYYYDSNDFDRDHQIDGTVRIKNMMTICALRKKHYDLCVGLREDLNNILIQKTFGAKKNISFHTNTLYAGLLDESVENDEKKHSAEINFDLLRLLDIEKPARIQPEIFTSPEDERWAKEFMADRGITERDLLIGVSPGGGWYLNWWPYQNYTTLINLLCQYSPRIKILMIGGRAEQEIAEKIKRGVKFQMISAVGETSIGQLVSLAKYMKLLITNDGGPMHLVTAAKTPVVALFGPSPCQRFGPVGEGHTIITKHLKCSPCPQFVQGEKPGCSDNKCMKAIEVQEVYDVVKEKIKVCL